MSWKRVHAQLLDDVVAGLRLEARDGRRAPGAAHVRAGRAHALEERGVLAQLRRALLDDVPDVDHGLPGGAERRCETRDVRYDAVPLAVVRRAARAERALAADRVVLHVLDDERDHGAATPAWRTAMRSA